MLQTYAYSANINILLTPSPAKLVRWVQEQVMYPSFTDRVSQPSVVQTVESVCISMVAGSYSRAHLLKCKHCATPTAVFGSDRHMYTHIYLPCRDPMMHTLYQSHPVEMHRTYEHEN